MPEHETHYVIVVHGTFNEAVEGMRKWYEFDEGNHTNFCQILNDLLAKLGQGRPVWRAINGERHSFSWTGSGADVDRMELSNPPLSRPRRPSRARHTDSMIYTHVLNRGGKGMRSPADALMQSLHFAAITKLCRSDSTRTWHHGGLSSD